MCPDPAWWETGLSVATIGVVALVTALVAVPAGWFAHSTRQWYRRMVLHLKFIRPLIKFAGYGVGGLLVVGFLMWSYLGV